jgi:hypothetical protein
VAYQLEPLPLEPGGRVHATLYFKLLRPLPDVHAPYRVLTHLTRACAGRNVFMADRPLGGEGFALDRWQVGTLLRQEAELEVPKDMRTSEGAVWVAIEQGKRRLPIAERGRTDLRQRLRLADVAVNWKAPIDPPTYPIHRAKGPIAVDGRLDEPDWQTAPSSGDFVRADGRAVSEDRTRAKLLWDDLNLYVAFEVEDRDLFTTFTTHDQPLYEQEVVELYLDPDGDGRTYHELQVSPANVTFDVYYPECREEMDLRWESGMVTAVRPDGTLNRSDDEDRGWTVELAIPLASLKNAPRLPPQPGDRWRGNLYRLDKRGKAHKQNMGSSWSPTFIGDYHTPTRWGTFEFVP